MHIDLSGQTVLVTGASRGIGAAIARRLGESGARVAVHYVRGRTAAQELAAEIGRGNADLVDLSTRGTLWTWTYCEIPLFGKKDTDVPGYGVGQVDLPEGPRIQSVLLGGPDDFQIGMELELDLEVLNTNRDGDDVVIYRFRPVESPTVGMAS